MSRLLTQLWMLMFLLLGAISHQSMAQNLRMRITPKTNLHSGNFPDGTELAVIYLSGVKDNCVLNVWVELAKDEVTPGHYTLYVRQGGDSRLSVRLAGEGWQPDIQSGKGVNLIKPSKFNTLKLLSNGEQFIDSFTWPINITAHCNRRQ